MHGAALVPEKKLDMQGPMMYRFMRSWELVTEFEPEMAEMRPGEETTKAIAAVAAKEYVASIGTYCTYRIP